MGSSTIPTVAYRGRECHASCVLMHLHYFFSCFWQHFCLIVPRFICRNLTLPLFKKVCSSETVIFLQWDQLLLVANQTFLPKIWSENCISLAIHPGITYFWIWLLLSLHNKERKRQRRRGGTDEQPLSNNLTLIRCGETYSTWQ